MRRTLKVFGYACLSLLSVDIFIGVIDWLARWDWLESMMLAHPHVAALVRTPLASLVLLVLGFTFLFAENRLKEPRLVARYANSRVVPDLHTTTMRVVFDSQKKASGWDGTRIDWDLFVEVQFANSSETPCTIDGLKTEVSIGPRWNKHIFRTQYLEDLEDFDMDMRLDNQGKGHGKPIVGDRYQPIPSLMSEIKNKPLHQEIGYRGWLHFKVFSSQSTGNEQWEDWDQHLAH
jgi:hypothetical protein